MRELAPWLRCQESGTKCATAEALAQVLIGVAGVVLHRVVIVDRMDSLPKVEPNIDTSTLENKQS